MTWNSPESLQRLRSCITALKLPPPPPAAVDGKIALQVLRIWSFSKAPFRQGVLSGAVKWTLFRRLVPKVVISFLIHLAPAAILVTWIAGKNGKKRASWQKSVQPSARCPRATPTASEPCPGTVPEYYPTGSTRAPCPSTTVEVIKKYARVFGLSQLVVRGCREV